MDVTVVCHGTVWGTAVDDERGTGGGWVGVEGGGRV